MNQIYRLIGVAIIAILIIPSLSFAQKYEKPTTPMKYWSKAQWNAWGNEMERRNLSKAAEGVDRRLGLHNGNKLRTLFYNYGSIGRPNTEPSIEWPIFSGNGYAYEFGAMVGAEVINRNDETLKFFSDAMADGGDWNPSGGSNIWGWEPLPGWTIDNSTYLSWSKDKRDRGGHQEGGLCQFQCPAGNGSERRVVWPASRWG